MSLVYLLTMLILKSQHKVLGLVLVDAEDAEGGDVAVVGVALPLLVHGVDVVAGARHQGQLVLHTLYLPGLLGQRRPAELHLNTGV